MKLIQTIIFTAILFGAGAKLKGQVNLQNTGILYITGPTPLLYVNGSMTNAAGGAFTNNGSLYVTGNITNNQVSMVSGAGTLYLNGSTLQQINGAQVFRTYNLVTNNASGLLLNNSLSVSAVHTFASGIISTSATPDYIIYEAGSSYTGDGDTRHVNGWARKSGTTAFSFPVGNGTVERKIGVSNISSATVFNAVYAGATTNTGNLASPLFVVDPNEYWQINKVSGGSANVNMSWDNSKVNMPNYGIADIRVANYIAANWTQVGGSASGSTSTTGTISSNLISSFGPFTFGSIAFTLPVHLLTFSAAKNNSLVILKWITTDEVNVSHHEIQRSDDGLIFTKIGSVTARNVQDMEAYEYTDSKALNGITFYRLRSVDKDGRSTLSRVVTVSGDATGSAELAIVNPAFKSIYGFTSNLSGTFQYQLNTMAGQTVQHGIVDINTSGLTIPLSGSVSKGIYLLRLQKPGINMLRKVVIGN